MRGSAIGVFLLFIGSLLGVWTAMTWTGVAFDPLTGMMISLAVFALMAAAHGVYHFAKLLIWAFEKTSHFMAARSPTQSHTVEP